MKLKTDALIAQRLALSFKPYFMSRKGFVEANLALDSLGKKAREAAYRGKDGIYPSREELSALIWAGAAQAKDGVLKEVRELLTAKTREDGMPAVYQMSYSPVLLLEDAGFDLKKAGGLEGLAEEAVKVLRFSSPDVDPEAERLEKEELVKNALVAAALANLPADHYLKELKELVEHYKEEFGDDRKAYKKAEGAVSKQITHLQDYYLHFISDVPVAGVLKPEETGINNILAAAYLLQRLDAMEGKEVSPDWNAYYSRAKELISSPQLWQEEVEKRLESDRFKEAVVYNYLVRATPLEPKAAVESASSEISKWLEERKPSLEELKEIEKTLVENADGLTGAFREKAYEVMEESSRAFERARKEKEQAKKELEEFLKLGM
jgi:hypothetical protein